MQIKDTQLMKKSEVEEMAKLFRRWRGERGKLEFFRFIFETNGFTCEEVGIDINF